MSQRFIICIGLIALIFGAGVSKGETTTDSLFASAVEQIGVVSRKKSIQAFEEIISQDRAYAPAYNELAKLHLLDHTVNGRQRAMRMIQKAIALDPDNVEYRLTRGKIWWAQGFRWRARHQYENVIEDHPDNTDALDGEGMYHVYEFLAIKDDNLSMRIDESRDFREYAQEAKRRAEDLLRTSIQMDERNQEPYYMLGMLYFENGDWDAFQALMQALHIQYPQNKNALLFCGLAAYQLDEYKDSHEYYQRAYDLMSVEERDLLDAIDLFVPPEDHASRDTTQTIDELLKREMFWKSQDPLYLSDFNERKMEHFGRMAYSNLRFRRFSDDVEGWQTDMGKTYIKFGRYRRRISGHRQSWSETAKKEIWFYEAFKIEYCGKGIDTWSFCGGFEIGSAIPSASVAGNLNMGFGLSLRKLLSNRDGVPDESNDDQVARLHPRRFPYIPLHLEEASHHIFRKTAQRFIDPYLKRKYTLPYQVATFEERDSIRVELSYMIPKNRLETNPKTGEVSVWDGVFLFDEYWNDIYNYRKSMTFALPPSRPATNTAAQQRNEHLLVSRMVSVPQGSYHFSVELLDQTSGAIGIARDEEQYVYADETFHLSDLLIANNIQARKGFPEHRDDLHITPNPVRTFAPSEPVFIYLELYDLTRDDFGNTQYDISYTIGKPEVDTLSPTLFTSQNVIDTLGTTTIDLRVEQAESNPAEDLERDQAQEGLFDDRGVVSDREIWGETKVYTSGGKVHHIAAEGLKIKRSKDGDVTRTVTADYEGNREHDFTYLQIDINQVPEGIYQLTVLARDKRTEQTDRKYVYFRIVE